MLNGNMQAPLLGVGQQTKIGQSGPVNWGQGARCQKLKVQFCDSLWNQNYFQVKQRVEWELLQLKLQLQLFKDINRMNVSIMPIYLIMLVDLIVYVVVLANIASDPSSDDNVDISTMAFIYLASIILLVCIAMAVICLFMGKITNKINLAIQFLNQRFHQQGLPIRIAAKKRICFISLLNVTNFQIFQRIQH